MKNNRRTWHYILAVIGVILGIIADQFTKYLALIYLKDQEPVAIWEDVFQLEYLENRGAAFGLFQERRLFFYLSAVLILGIVIWFYRKVPLNRRFLPLRICAVFISAGAIGNLTDRIRLNYVIDFLYFKLIDFPVFNVADIYVTVSAALFFVLFLFYYKEEDLEQIFPSRK